MQNTSTELNIAQFGHMMSKGLNWDQRCVGFILNCSVFFFGPSYGLHHVLYQKQHNLKLKSCLHLQKKIIYIKSIYIYLKSLL